MANVDIDCIIKEIIGGPWPMLFPAFTPMILEHNQNSKRTFLRIMVNLCDGDGLSKQ